MVTFTDKRERSIEHLIPVREFQNVFKISEKYGRKLDTVWAWCCDGKPHRYAGKRIPAIVGNCLLDVFGIDDITLRAVGYVPCWHVFEDMDSGEFSFGNRPSFIRSRDAESLAIGYAMPVIDFQEIKKL